MRINDIEQVLHFERIGLDRWRHPSGYEITLEELQKSEETIEADYALHAKMTADIGALFQLDPTLTARHGTICPVSTVGAPEEQCRCEVLWLREEVLCRIGGYHLADRAKREYRTLNAALAATLNT